MSEITSQQFMQRILGLVERLEAGSDNRHPPIDWHAVTAARWVNPDVDEYLALVHRVGDQGFWSGRLHAGHRK